MSSFTALFVACLLVAAGVGVLFPPAGLVLGGLLVGALGLFVDDGR